MKKKVTKEHILKVIDQVLVWKKRLNFFCLLFLNQLTEVMYSRGSKYQ